MISRHWKGIAKRERADEYVAHLENETFKALQNIKGFISARILLRDVDHGVEFLIITDWESVEAIKQFAGDAYSTAVVPDVVKEIMISYDREVSHYDVKR